MNLKTKFIIPAAGYGTRVGSPEAKELIIYNDEPMIKRFIDLGKKLNIRCHVITRIEKKSLIEFLKNFDHVDIQIIEPSKEWPDTILQSQIFWEFKNILLLPDTDFSPWNTIESIINSLDSHDLSVGAFENLNYKTWGTFKYLENNYHLIEKPNTNEKDLMAWGILGFKKTIGEELFKLILESTFDHQVKKTHFSYEYFKLEYFKDLTR